MRYCAAAAPLLQKFLASKAYLIDKSWLGRQASGTGLGLCRSLVRADYLASIHLITNTADFRGMSSHCSAAFILQIRMS